MWLPNKTRITVTQPSEYEPYVWTFILCMYDVNVYLFTGMCCIFTLRCVVVLVNDYAGNDTSSQTERMKTHFFLFFDATSVWYCIFFIRSFSAAWCKQNSCIDLIAH